jgi:hypothetical protein
MKSQGVSASAVEGYIFFVLKYEQTNHSITCKKDEKIKLSGIMFFINGDWMSDAF